MPVTRRSAVVLAIELTASVFAVAIAAYVVASAFVNAFAPQIGAHS